MNQQSQVVLSLSIMSLLAVMTITSVSFNRYISSPGYTTAELAARFEEIKPNCIGKSVLVNRDATFADAPGKSICFGYLSRNY